MKIRVTADEWYPMYCTDKEPKSYGREIEVDEAWYSRYESILHEFLEMQRHLENLHDEAGYKK